jgi:hypothetical protein
VIGFNQIEFFDHTGFGNLEFAPASRIAYNWSDRWAMALEEYAALGPLRQFPSRNGQFHEVWAVLDHKGKVLSIEAGVGVGVTAGADTLTFKLMVSRDLNSRRGQPSYPKATSGAPSPIQIGESGVRCQLDGRTRQLPVGANQTEPAATSLPSGESGDDA